MSNVNDLLTQALALVNEDQGGELNDIELPRALESAALLVCTGRADVADLVEIARAYAAHARRQTLEDVCGLVCKWCAAGRPVEPVSDGYWLHPSVTPDLDHWEWCRASYVRHKLTAPYDPR